jgi:hypothetical protein
LTFALFPSFLSLQGLLKMLCLSRWLTTSPVIILSRRFSLVFYPGQRYGFHSSAVALVISFLFPWHLGVGCCDDFSSLTLLVAGVIQRFYISLLCFSLFIDDMTDVLEFSKFHIYIDDLQINHIRSWPKNLLSECIQEVNSNRHKIFD